MSGPSCSAINNLTETSRLSKLNCASEDGRLEGERRGAGGGQRGPIRIVFYEVEREEREKERAARGGGRRRGYRASGISLAPSAGR